jgi:hypothetical protein
MRARRPQNALASPRSNREPTIAPKLEPEQQRAPWDVTVSFRDRPPIRKRNPCDICGLNRRLEKIAGEWQLVCPDARSHAPAV